MDIKVTGHEYFYDITSMSMLFFPGEKTNYVKRSNNETHIISTLKIINSKYLSLTRIKFKGNWYSSQKTCSITCDSKNLVKQTFYKACSKATGISSPWGILTGIRPLSVYKRHFLNRENVANIMKNEYYLHDDKIELLDNIFKIEKDLLNSNKSDVSIYISIPFCPSKCSYCSFISVAATKTGDLANKYFDLLIKEIKLKSQLIKIHKLNVKSLYVGGGTPGTLDENKIDLLLSTLDQEFKLKTIDELTFEIGRPETITHDKLKILKKYNVNRICINTQTTNDKILASVNRKHSAKMYFNAVNLAKSVGFESINTDLIAGLPNEDVDSFIKSVDDVISTGVNNITIHTLSIKKSAVLSDEGKYYNPSDVRVRLMLESAYHKLAANGYVPYYIYRQKNCVSNGENIGFCKPNKLCKYNVYMMEDVHSIISCGAGASSKIINGTEVSRVINVKYPMEYVNEFYKINNNNIKLDNILKAKSYNERNRN